MCENDRDAMVRNIKELMEKKDRMQEEEKEEETKYQTHPTHRFISKK